MKLTSRLTLALSVALALGAASAHAQDYPTQHTFDARTITATHVLNRAATLSVVDAVVYFKNGSSALTPEGSKQVAKIASIIKDPSFRTCRHLIVKGFTDNKGSDASNQKLSYHRAMTVMKVLISKYGVSAEKLTAEGLGKENPVADNATAAGRALNRRVIVVDGDL